MPKRRADGVEVEGRTAPRIILMQMARRCAMMATAVSLALAAAPASAQLRTIQLNHNDPATLRQMQKFAGCVARAKPKAVAAVLARSPDDPAYHDILRHLSQERPTCLPRGGIMAFSNLAIAGAMAEWMVLHNDRGGRLERAAAAGDGALPPGRSDLERFSLCVVKAAPEQTLLVLRSDIGSQSEIDAMKGMSDALVGCVGPALSLRFGKPTLRGGLAIAAYRLTLSTPVAGTN